MHRCATLVIAYNYALILSNRMYRLYEALCSDHLPICLMSESDTFCELASVAAPIRKEWPLIRDDNFDPVNLTTLFSMLEN